jgi:hypothetical protein
MRQRNPMRTTTSIMLSSSLLLFACSGGSGSQDRSGSSSVGGLHVVVDTRASTEAVVQWQLAVVTLEDQDGMRTGNLLREAQLVTFTDPLGEPGGFRLPVVPTGEYRALRLLLVPGTGRAVDADGELRAVTGPVDLHVPLPSGLSHTTGLPSWIVVGHDAPPLPLARGGDLTWNPQLAGRVDGEFLTQFDLADPVDNGGGITAMAAAHDAGALENGCRFENGDGVPYADRTAFLADLAVEDGLCVDGRIERDGRLRASVVRRGRGHRLPRLIGRIEELRPLAESFVFRVRARTRGGHALFLDPPENVLVLAADARLQRPNGAPLAFGDLAVGHLARVSYRSITRVPGSLPEVVARIVEVPMAGVPLDPQWQGRVQAVDLVLRTILVVPRGGDPIVVQGLPQTQVTVEVTNDTVIERRERQGPGRYRIELEDIVAGEDRIWFRGEVTAPAGVRARYVRVRED